MPPAWAKTLVSDDVVRDDLRALLLRRQIRYWMFRLQTAATGGPKAEKVPRGFKTFFEKQEPFDGWENFGQTWNVESDSPLVVKARYLTIQEEWDAVLHQGIRSDEIATRQRLRKQQRESDGTEGNV